MSDVSCQSFCLSVIACGSVSLCAFCVSVYVIVCFSALVRFCLSLLVLVCLSSFWVSLDTICHPSCRMAVFVFLSLSVYKVTDLIGSIIQYT